MNIPSAVRGVLYRRRAGRVIPESAATVRAALRAAGSGRATHGRRPLVGTESLVFLLFVERLVPSTFSLSPSYHSRPPLLVFPQLSSSRPFSSASSCSPREQRALSLARSFNGSFSFVSLTVTLCGALFISGRRRFHLSLDAQSAHAAFSLRSFATIARSFRKQLSSSRRARARRSIGRSGSILCSWWRGQRPFGKKDRAASRTAQRRRTVSRLHGAR